MKTFLKWAGNKSRIKNTIIKHIEPNSHFIEPFAGSCAISLNIKAKSYFLSDANKDLINLYNLIMQNNNFIEYSKSFFTQDNNTNDKYYELRELFNTTNQIELKSALFIYLNKHTFNGLCRYNKNGQFNAPYGKYKKPYFPEKEIYQFKDKLKDAKFVHQDFRVTMSQANKGDVVYCDPPYVQLSKTSNFTAYTESGFNKKDQSDLLVLAEQLRNKGVKVIISNHNTEQSKALYKNANLLEEFKVQRNISADGNNRRKVSELVAVYNG